MQMLCSHSSIPFPSFASMLASSGAQTQLMTATFKTTDGHAIPMSYGIAPSESIPSWCFFLINLRQVLKMICSHTCDWNQISFMSDRNPGILAGVEKHFPESHHSYCVVHILRNVNVKGINIFQYWKAVEATCEEDFITACINANSSKLLDLMKQAEHWCRYAIAACGCRRFGSRSNNPLRVGTTH